MKEASARLYQIWQGMRQRCNNPKAPAYDRYGGRGITIDPAWDVFNVFYNWAMANGYSAELSIERRDNNDGYFPDNCTWASDVDQACNRRKQSGTNSKYIGVRPNGNGWQSYCTYKGTTHSLGTYELQYDAAKARDDFVKANGLPHKLNFD